MEDWIIVLGAVNVLLGLYSLRSSFTYRRYAHRARTSTAEGPAGRAVLFVPCCGDEPGLEANLDALIEQDYPELRVQFVVESDDDGALPVIRRVLRRHEARGDVAVAGPARGIGQKVHNLLEALDKTPEAEVYVFADSDGRPDAGWLGRLVQGLARPGAGVASCYRFYLPEPPAGFATLLRSVWNASVLSLLGDGDHNFAWGGGMAIRRDTFEAIGVRDAWAGALSDDYALTHAVRRAGLRVEFRPDCLVASYGSVSLLPLMSWVTRQIAITRVYWPALFRIAAANHAVHSTFLVAGSWYAVRGSLTQSMLLGIVLVLGAASGAIRVRALEGLVPEAWGRSLRRYAWAYAFLVPISSLLTAQAVARAFLSRRIEWRGRVYEMRSPNETVVVHGPGSQRAS